jgi:RNA polymerase sigma-70 factor, ECF subfamily
VPKSHRPSAEAPASGEGAPARGLAASDETTLRKRLVDRDEHALVELIELASPWLLGVAESLLGDPDEAEEVVLEVFATAWDRATSLGPGHEMLMPWLLRITRNRAIDRLRRRARWRRKTARAGAFGEIPSGQPVSAEFNEAARPGWHVHESVHRALAGLPPEQEEVVRLAYFGGLTQSEIAARLSIPIGTVKTRLRLAFDKLRTALSPLRDWVL